MHLELDYEQMAEVSIFYLQECLDLETKFDNNPKVIKHYLKTLKDIMPPGEYVEFKKAFKEKHKLDGRQVQGIYHEHPSRRF